MLQRYCSDGSGKFEDGRANVKVDAKPYRRAPNGEDLRSGKQGSRRARGVGCLLLTALAGKVMRSVMSVCFYSIFARD